MKVWGSFSSLDGLCSISVLCIQALPPAPFSSDDLYSESKHKGNSRSCTQPLIASMLASQQISDRVYFRQCCYWLMSICPLPPMHLEFIFRELWETEYLILLWRVDLHCLHFKTLPPFVVLLHFHRPSLLPMNIQLMLSPFQQVAYQRLLTQNQQKMRKAWQQFRFI